MLDFLWDNKLVDIFSKAGDVMVDVLDGAAAKAKVSSDRLKHEADKDADKLKEEIKWDKQNARILANKARINHAAKQVKSINKAQAKAVHGVQYAVSADGSLAAKEEILNLFGKSESESVVKDINPKPDKAKDYSFVQENCVN